MKRILATLAALGTVAFAHEASAFCGFYVGGADAKLFNNATQVVLMREGTRTVLSMQNNYEGPPSNFAMVVPVPVVLQKENVKTLPREIFQKVDALSAPRLVEYWEQDPCAIVDNKPSGGGGMPRPMAAAAAGKAEDKSLGVKIEAQFTVGEYEIVILSAKEATGLETWLKQQKYAIPEGAAPYFKPYIQSGSKFFVAKVNAEKVKFEKGMAMLSPLRFHYDAETFQLPVRLGLMNAKGAQDLIVHILAKQQRYEVSNYPNVTIPTNYDVAENAKGDFGAFYAALFDKTVEKTPKAVVTEYAWDASTCDPCPGPALYPQDFASLGADVLPSAEALNKPAPAGSGATAPTAPLSLPRRPGPSPMAPRNLGPAVPMPITRRPMPYGGYTITRLHARYTKETLGEDLVFKAAPAIVGGREMRVGGAELEHGSQPSPYGMNNFQGRYAVRHPWTGPIACEHPQRGVWGGPPAGASGGQAVPARDTAFAPRGSVQLASYLRSAVPELSIEPQGAPVSANPASSAAPPPSAAASGATTPGTPPPGAKSSCSIGGADGGSLLVLGAALGLLGRRRNSRRRKVSESP